MAMANPGWEAGIGLGLIISDGIEYEIRSVRIFDKIVATNGTPWLIKRIAVVSWQKS